MNILYITNLSGNLFAGPNNSVPAQIKAQQKYDNVFWYNLNNNKRDEWKAIGCHNMQDYPSGRLEDLPVPFNSPDLIVVEEFYCYPFSKTLIEIQRKEIPYIIIPRSELTEQAQKKSAFKKCIGNFLFFNSLVKRATAIQYLSAQERSQSINRWKCNSFIIPNGANISPGNRGNHEAKGINAVYIGRYEKYQKGLDLLICAIDKTKTILRENNFCLNMYGVDQSNTVEMMEEEIKAKNLSDLIKINPAVYGFEKTKILDEADIFILTSRFEGMPMGLIEALSHGLAALVTKGTNMGTEISLYRAGWVAENSVEGIVKSIEDMINQYNDLDKFSKSAILLSKQYSWDRIAKFAHNQYEHLCNGEQVTDFALELVSDE